MADRRERKTARSVRGGTLHDDVAFNIYYRLGLSWGGASVVRTLWFVLLLSAICLEGLGRRYLPAIPATAFYFAKDAVLLLGFYFFRPPAAVSRASAFLYRGFKPALIAAAVWTVGELLNPEQQSYLLGIIGLRSYWFWWLLAPSVMACALQQEREKRRAIYALLVMAAGIAILAAIQFAAPADSPLNTYSVVDGEDVHPEQVAVSGGTAHARVASTFSYISGFSDFTLLVPTLLLSIGLDAKDKRLQRFALISTALTAAVVPMSGSRTSVILGIGILGVTAFSAGLFATRAGRRIMAGAIVAAIFSVVIFPDALLGVQARFGDTEETQERITTGIANVVPPLALATFDYPPFGVGTGMMQNARFAMHIQSQWNNELEAARYLAELGPVGYLLVWTTRLGLIIALLRAHRILKSAGRRGAASAATSYAFLTVVGNLTFDHIFQALYFIGCGFILSEVVSAMRSEVGAVTSISSTPSMAIVSQTSITIPATTSV